MARTYTHFAYIEDDADDYEVEVVYTISPGCAEQGPTYSCGGQPAEPPEVELQAAYRIFYKPGSLTVERGKPVELSAEDEKSIHQWLIENHEPEERE